MAVNGLGLTGIAAVNGMLSSALTITGLTRPSAGNTRLMRGMRHPDMDKPLCRLCNVRHFSSSPHVFKDIVNEEAKRPSPEKQVKATQEVPEKIEPAAAKPKRKPKVKGFDRVKYQRDYMRKRRAEGKA